MAPTSISVRITGLTDNDGVRRVRASNGRFHYDHANNANIAPSETDVGGGAAETAVMKSATAR
jgi:hypothetical protein